MEKWVPIIGFECSHEISNFGKVRSLERINSRGVKIPSRELKILDRGTGYLYTELNHNGVSKKCSIHRAVAMAFIEGFTEKDIVDHIDGNKKNNCVFNLRIADKYTNQYNRKATENNSSKYKGVSFDKSKSLWRVGITVKGEKRIRPFFKDEIDAAIKYDELAVKHFGEFALTNKMLGLLK